MKYTIISKPINDDYTINIKKYIKFSKDAVYFVKKEGTIEDYILKYLSYVLVFPLIYVAFLSLFPFTLRIIKKSKFKVGERVLVRGYFKIPSRILIKEYRRKKWYYSIEKQGEWQEDVISKVKSLNGD